MQKYLKILENNVHWIALGLGGLYLLWMVYANVFSNPVSIKIAGNKEVYPENVDEEISKDKGAKLEAAMKPSEITLPTFDVLTPYMAKLDEKDAKIPEVAIDWAGTRGILPAGDGPDLVGPNGQAKIAKLPVLPKAVYVDDSHGITVVNAGGAAPAANGGAQPVGLVGQDTRWESLRFKVPMGDVSKAFTDTLAAPGIARLFVTEFLQIELWREEQLPNGQWSEPKPVKLSDIEGLPTPYPGDSVNVAERTVGFKYKSDAANAQKEIVTPTFPAIVPGAPAWYAPGQAAPQRGRPAGNPVPGAPARPAAVVRPSAPVMQGFAPPAAPNPRDNAAVPAGMFDVTANVGDKEIIIHDLTVEDGKTYRYAIKYKLANPVWDSNFVTSNLNNVYALVSELSDWTPEIKVKRHTRLFVAAATATKVTFDVYEWKAGNTVHSRADAVPGDTIKDFTVVDIRPEAFARREPAVLLLEGPGQLKIHTKRSDSEDPDYSEFRNEPPPGVPTPK